MTMRAGEISWVFNPLRTWLGERGSSYDDYVGNGTIIVLLLLILIIIGLIILL
ncbi:hypothetical protein [Thermococcus chitonophagus]|uniref:Uncharacterized protein n=1 Tax=Thermococcus chitonophagus TaxID=54262 RepID=A0A160VRC4_9EURY|nr:hypothetical protein [Thermococcus chitonophagus]CUX77465.1 hypothetical protein CHITON_0686 [Thermococcus chitonophagus]